MRPVLPDVFTRVMAPAAAKEATCCLSDGFQLVGDPPAMFLFLVFNSASGKNKTEGVLSSATDLPAQ